ncbi:MAG TPA: hypothetical protein DDY74_09660, partial [Pseudothermotoga sp.]|nr:hypothetical protein [Pseudothermotoga sp.]
MSVDFVSSACLYVIQKIAQPWHSKSGEWKRINALFNLDPICVGKHTLLSVFEKSSKRKNVTHLG